MPFPTETREKRFLVPADQVEAVRSWARARFRPDPHGGGLHGDTYDTTSLYFDNAEFDVFHRRGSYGRAKYRVRRYGAAPFVFLERKLKTSDLVSKRRSAIPIGELSRLASPEPRKGWPGYWFHRRIQRRGLRPVCRVSYTRTALEQTDGHGPARLTLDVDLRAAAARDAALEPLPAMPDLIGGAAILELKYYRAPPPVFSELIEEFSLAVRPISKYETSAAALQLVPAGV